MNRSRQAGFSLIEMTIVMALIAAVAAAVVPAIDSGMRFAQRLKTESRLGALQVALEQVYASQAQLIDADPGAVLTVRRNGTDYQLTDGPTRPDAGNPGWRVILDAAGGNPDAVLTDGFNRYFRMFISNRLSTTIDGLPVSYHVIALVSNNGRQAKDSYQGDTQKLQSDSPLDKNTGVLTLGAGEIGIVVSGLTLQAQKLRDTQARIRRLTKLYETYYQTQYLGNPNRDIGMDYFSRAGSASADPANWDNTSEILHTGASETGMTVAESNLAATFNLVESDYLDAWGQPIRVDNGSAKTRNPDNGDAPPFTARFFTTLPSGEEYAQAVVGSY